jgi:hypothetical protein
MTRRFDRVVLAAMTADDPLVEVVFARGRLNGPAAAS